MKTRGGWEAIKIWENTTGFYAIHKPKTEHETVPIFHFHDGVAVTAFSVNEPPVYGQHPADIIDFND